MELRSLFHAKKLMTPELVVNVEAPDGLAVPGSPTVNQLLKETAIAPETPAIHSTLMGVSEVHKLTDSDRVVPASSFESSQQRQSSSENEEFDILMNEVHSWLSWCSFVIKSAKYSIRNIKYDDPLEYLVLRHS